MSGRVLLYLTWAFLLGVLLRPALTDEIVAREGPDFPVVNYKLESTIHNWEEVVPLPEIQPSNLTIAGLPSQSVVPIPVFVSLTSVSFRIGTLMGTLRTIFDGIVVPSHVFLFVSKAPYLLDEGVESIPDELLALVVRNLLTIVFTENIGPHRKLLPILERFYEDDVLIVNIDDDMVYQPQSTLLYQLLRYYNESDGQSVVALRSRRIGFCQESVLNATNNTEQFSGPRSDLFSTYINWDVHYAEGRKEMFVLPTGTGGVLYRPRFFHPVVLDPDFRTVTGTADDLMFRLACLATGTPVVIACRDLEQNNRIVRRCPVDPAFLPPGFLPDPAVQKLPPSVNQTGNATAVAKHPQTHRLRKAAHRMQLEAAAEADAYTEAGAEGQAEKLVVLESEENHRLLRPSLYHLNMAGLNDAQWRNAVRFLQERRILNMTQLFLQHHREREKACYPHAELVVNTTTQASYYRIAKKVPDGCSIARCTAVKPKTARRSRQQHWS